METIGRWGLSIGFALVALGCGGSGTSSDVTDWAGVDDGGSETVPDASDVPPDGGDDTPPDGGDDTPPDAGPDGDGTDGDRTPDRPDASPEGGYDGSGGCDPTVCQIQCALGGYAAGTCIGDSCECSGTGDGGPVDGWDPDGLEIRDGLPDGIIPDGILPDGLPDGWGDFTLPDGFELPDGWEFGADGTPDATIDVGTCDMTACFEACRADGHTFGFCNAAGECVCY